jgi:hypothetical protein
MDDFTKMAAMVGGGGLVATCWAHIKSFLLRVTGLLIVRVEAAETPGTCMGDAFRAMLIADFTTFSAPFRQYGFSQWFVQPKARYERVVHETFLDASRVYWKGWRPLVVSGYGKRLAFIRGTFDPDELAKRAPRLLPGYSSTDTRFAVMTYQGKGRQNATDQHEKHPSPGGTDKAMSNASTTGSDAEQAACVRLLDYQLSEIGQPREGSRTLDRLALSDDVVTAVEEARRWVKSGAWYRERQLPWRRGWLLHGSPGCGKSSLSVAIAQDLNVPLYRFDIASMSNAEFSMYWRNAISNTPSIVLLEDVDSVFQGRTNVIGEMGGGLSFDHLLNVISGVENTDGIFLIITTNNVGAIDPALGIPGEGAGAISSRPGRIDRALKLGNPTPDGLRKIATRILAEKANLELIERLVVEGVNDSGAQFQERCSMLALKLFWETAT